MDTKDKICVWKLFGIDSNSYELSCDTEHLFWLEEGNPIENGWKYCPYCGNVLEVDLEILEKFEKDI